jgi:hypothetical protein
VKTAELTFKNIFLKIDVSCTADVVKILLFEWLFDTQKGRNADCVDMKRKTVYTLCVTVPF